MNQLTIQMTSVPDRENIVAEIWFGNDQVGEVSSDLDGKLVIEIYAHPAGGAWSFDFGEFQLILNRARDNLIGSRHGGGVRAYCQPRAQ